MTLDQLGVKHATGKSSLKCHYLSFYELLFGHWHNRWFHLLEVGVQFGNSLRVWEEYFTNAHITGVDITSNGLSYPQEFSAGQRVRLVTGNAYTTAMLKVLGEGAFDVIIDDASHTLENQTWFAAHYPSLLSPKGILIIEDILGVERANTIADALPKGFSKAVIDLRTQSVNPDNILLLAWH